MILTLLSKMIDEGLLMVMDSHIHQTSGNISEMGLDRDVTTGH